MSVQADCPLCHGDGLLLTRFGKYRYSEYQLSLIAAVGMDSANMPRTFACQLCDTSTPLPIDLDHDPDFY